MTLTEFLLALKAALTIFPRWDAGSFRVGAIRTRNEAGQCFCPLTAVYYHRSGCNLGTWSFERAGSRLGLSPEDVASIARAADSSWIAIPEDSLTRTHILSAVGLEDT